MINNKNIVRLNKLYFSREDKNIFSNIDLKIKEGSITCIIGPSGAGKTTLLKLICGQLKPDRGIIEIDNDRIDNISNCSLNNIRKKIGMLFQSGALFNDMNVFDNVAFPILEHMSLDRDMIKDLVSMKLNAVNLLGAKNLMPSQLSGGMRRRVAFARTIALDPKLTLFDEPFAGQDPINKKILSNLIKSFNQSFKSSSIIVSHDIKTALEISDYLYIISNGCVVCKGTPSELLTLENNYARQFINGSQVGPLSFNYKLSSGVKNVFNI